MNVLAQTHLIKMVLLRGTLASSLPSFGPPWLTHAYILPSGVNLLWLLHISQIACLRLQTRTTHPPIACATCVLRISVTSNHSASLLMFIACTSSPRFYKDPTKVSCWDMVTKLLSKKATVSIFSMNGGSSHPPTSPSIPDSVNLCTDARQPGFPPRYQNSLRISLLTRIRLPLMILVAIFCAILRLRLRPPPPPYKRHLRLLPQPNIRSVLVV